MVVHSVSNRYYVRPSLAHKSGNSSLRRPVTEEVYHQVNPLVLASRLIVGLMGQM